MSHFKALMYSTSRWLTEANYPAYYTVYCACTCNYIVTIFGGAHNTMIIIKQLGYIFGKLN